MEIRAAKTEELDAIYMMGYDAWSDGVSKKDYLDECRTSKKYKAGKWYVLLDGEELISSLAVYSSGFGIPQRYCGIGSAATKPQKRSCGYACKLLIAVCKILQREGFNGVYLHSDIESSFYERLGFTVVAESASKCMALPFSQLERLPEEIPSYF